jgi:hypothetical protein
MYLLVMRRVDSGLCSALILYCTVAVVQRVRFFLINAVFDSWRHTFTQRAAGLHSNDCECPLGDLAMWVGLAPVSYSLALLLLCSGLEFRLPL